jgi:hypothetical protein
MINKSVKIDQLVDLEVFELALTDYLNGCYSEEYITEQLRINISGENRIKKGLRIVNKVIRDSPIDRLLINNKEEILNAMNNNDKRIIIVSLLNSSYSFAFYLLRIFGKFFNVQDIVNIKVIQKEISKVYGGNRVAINGIYCVGPIFEKAGIYIKAGMGLYQFNDTIPISSTIAKDLFIESFRINMDITDVDDLNRLDPYFTFIQ